MKSKFKSAYLFLVALIVTSALACERKPAQPVKSPPPPSAAAPSSGNDSRALAEFLNKDKPQSSAMGSSVGTKGATDSLPPGHPPIGGVATSQPASSGLPAGHPSIGATPSMMAADQNDEVTPLKFDAPTEWKPQTPSSAMRKAQFLLPRTAGDSEDGQLIVFQFGRGQGGAVEMNIDRWIGMFSTKEGKPVDKESVKRETREVGGLKVTTLDISGRFTDAMMGVSTGAAKDNYRMLSAIVETPEGPWFFKGVGPDATMQSHRDEFAKMLNTIRR